MARKYKKEAQAYRTISEAAEELDLQQHVLRFWETKFSVIRPVKLAGSRRYYRAQDIKILAAIKSLLYMRGYKISGVQRILKEKKIAGLLEEAQGGALSQNIAGLEDNVEQKLTKIIEQSEVARTQYFITDGNRALLENLRAELVVACSYLEDALKDSKEAVHGIKKESKPEPAIAINSKAIQS